MMRRRVSALATGTLLVTATKGTLPAPATVSSTTWDTNAANDTASTAVKVGNGR